MSLIPHLIDTLNRSHAEAIAQLENMSRHLQQLQQLGSTLDGVVTHISTMGRGFCVEITVNGYWMMHRTELAALLHDYQYMTPIDRNHQSVISMHREMPLALLMVFRAERAAA